jgi:hypothetical protein
MKRPMPAGWNCRTLALVPLLAVVAGCASPYVYGSLGEAVAQPRSSGCEVSLLFSIPARAYDPLGVLAPLDIESKKLLHDESRFRSAVRAQICAAGGDAVIVERDSEGRYVRATVIKHR